MKAIRENTAEQFSQVILANYDDRKFDKLVFRPTDADGLRSKITIGNFNHESRLERRPFESSSLVGKTA